LENCSYKFNIIHEAAADSDLFEDRTHENVANNLFDLIDSSERGVTIGLEGGWGAGKSTVINLLKNKFNSIQNNGTLFFQFDAWAHDGDPLRRIFLESLIDCVDPQGEDNYLQALGKEISGRTKKVEVTTKKSTSKLGGWLSVSAVFVPVGAAILSALNYSNLTFFDFSYPLHLHFIVGLILTLFPLWILFYWLFWGEKDSTGKRNWDFFQSDSTENYTQDITEDGERTSIEFERFFKKIMAHSVGATSKYKRAIIVVDNLDRVDPSQTLTIWSILQTFFQYRSNPSRSIGNDWTSRIWFLVPYDREGLSQVWRDRNSTVIIGGAGESKDLNTLQKNQVSNLASSFLEKCFQIIAEVPEPVMSAWVEYAEKMISESLYGWPKEKIDEVTATYKNFESRLESSPTPRQIQSFVNRIGMLGMRWKDEMSAEAIALYALYRRAKSDRQFRKGLLGEGLPDGFEGSTSNNELKKQLAGMLFGVNKEKGIQLLLGPSIRSSLVNGDTDGFKSLIDDHNEAFWVVWHAVKSSILPKGHAEDYRIEVTKAFCGAVINHKMKAIADINALISEWKNNSEKWDFDKFDYSISLNSLIEAIGNQKVQSEFLVWLKPKVIKAIQNTVPILGDEKFKTARLYNIYALIELLKKNKILINQSSYQELNREKWKIWVDGLSYEGVDIKCVLPAKDTIKNLSSAINPTSLNIDLIKLLTDTVSYNAKSVEWETIAEKLKAYCIHPNRQVGIDEIYELMLMVYVLCNQKCQRIIKDIVENEQFRAKTQSENIASVPSISILSALVYKNDLLNSNISKNVKTFWQEEYSPEKHTVIIDKLRELKRLNILLLLATDAKNKIAVNFINNNEDESIFSDPFAIQYVDEYDWASNEKKAEIISKSIQQGGLDKAKQDLIDEPTSYRFCLELLHKYGGVEGRNVVSEALNKTTVDQWVEALKIDCILVNCIEDQGNHHFKLAVQKLLIEDLDKEELSHHLWEEFSVIYGKLQDKLEVSKKIADKYFKLNNDPLSDSEFIQVSQHISECLFFIEQEQLTSRLELWLIEQKWSRISWLLSNKMNFEGRPNESLISRVNEMVADDNENMSILHAIADTFNFQIESNIERKDDGE